MANFVYDTFTESSDTALTAHTGETGATWTANSGWSTTAPEVVAATDAVRINSTTEGGWYASGLPLGIDYDVQATVEVASADGYTSLAARFSTTARDFYQAFIDSAASGGEGYVLGKYVGGVFTSFAVYNTTAADGDVLKLRVRGATVRMFVNGVQRGTANDTSHTSANRAGIVGATYAAPGDSVGYHFSDFIATDPPCTYVNAGTVGTGGTTSVNVPYPASITAGNLLVAVVGNRPNAQTPDDISGWTKVTATGGAGSEAAGTGTIRGTIYWKIADGTESGNLAVSCTSGTSMFGRMFKFAKDTGRTWDVATVSGSDNTAGTSWSATASSDPGIQADDIVLCCSINSEDTARTSTGALSTTGVTYYDDLELQDSGITTGNDLGMIVYYFPVDSGKSSAAPVYTMTMTGTNAANSAGVTWFVRLRASNAPTMLNINQAVNRAATY